MSYELKTVYSPDEVQAGDRVEITSVHGGVIVMDLLSQGPCPGFSANDAPTVEPGTRVWSGSLVAVSGGARRLGLNAFIFAHPAAFPEGRVRVRRRPPESLAAPVAVTKRKPVRA